jgi:hypothetical protein
VQQTTDTLIETIDGGVHQPKELGHDEYCFGFWARSTAKGRPGCRAHPEMSDCGIMAGEEVVFSRWRRYTDLCWRTFYSLLEIVPSRRILLSASLFPFIYLSFLPSFFFTFLSFNYLLFLYVHYSYVSFSSIFFFLCLSFYLSFVSFTLPSSNVILFSLSFVSFLLL